MDSNKVASELVKLAKALTGADRRVEHLNNLTNKGRDFIISLDGEIKGLGSDFSDVDSKEIGKLVSDLKGLKSEIAKVLKTHTRSVNKYL